MKFKTLLLLAVAAGWLAPASVYADDYVDDIYYNPKKDKYVGAKKKNPNYIENFSDIDVDAYNLRGQYYTTPIDTIGAKVSSEEDFVYTQQIQKYYNPTIVLDNSQLLADVLQNSYGNVEIVYNGVTPAFLPTYGYGWPYYRSYYDPWYWNIGFGGWGISIGGWYDPWYWGPSWAWGPSWSWGWGPSWGWGGPAWGPGPSWGRPNGSWNPGGNRPVNPGVGWAGNSRHPNGNRPAGTARPGNNRPSSGSQWSIAGNHRGNYGNGNSSRPGTASTVSNQGGYVTGKDGHRYKANGTVNNSTANSNRNNGTVNTNRYTGNSRGNSYNHNTNSNRNTNYNSNRSNSNTTRNSGSYNSGRSSGGGSYGGGSFGGSRGGGGGRGGRR